jgi:Zn-dependent protease with chaperone function
MWWKKKSVYLLALSLLLATFVWIQMGMFLTHLVFGVQIKLNIFKFCLSLFQENSFYYGLAIYAMNTIIALTLLMTLIKIVEQFTLFYRFNKRIMAIKDWELSEFYSEVFGDNDRLTIVKSEQSLAFTMGIRSPSIVLSTSLINLLEEEELKAVIEHERFHQNNRDPLLIFILQIIAQSLWFIPLTKWCYENYKIICEILADEYAIKHTGSQLGLGSALLKLIRHRITNETVPMTVPFSGQSINYRLQQLVEPKRDIPVKIKPVTIFISIYALLLFIGMMFIALA